MWVGRAWPWLVCASSKNRSCGWRCRTRLPWLTCLSNLPARVTRPPTLLAPLQEVAARHAELYRVLEQGVVISAERTPPSQFDHKSYLLTVRGCG